MARIAIVGAGMAGLSALQLLAAQGHEVTIFDKSRGSGGRMATKKVGDVSWDMGAQFIRAHSAAFTAQLQQWQQYGWVDEWNITPWTADANGLHPSPDNVQRYVGMPRMTGLSRSLLEPAAAFIASTRIVSASREANSRQWSLSSEDDRTFGPYDGLLINTPPQQAVPLLSAVPQLAAQCEQVNMLPCWTLLLTLPEAMRSAPDAVFVKQGPLGWIARNSGKPGRDIKEAWVIQASHEWSRQHTDAQRELVQQELLHAFFATLQQPAQQPDTLWLHRWLYAIPANSLTLGALSDIDQHLVVCGDWCHSPSLEGAWLSGQQAARTLMTTPDYSRRTTMTLKTASILLAHGSSDPHWLEPFEQLLQRIRDSLNDPQARTELAYMELAEPSLQYQVRRLAGEGYRQIDVLPLFFAAGRHLRKDVPAMLDEMQQLLQQEGTDISIHLHPPIGLEPEVAKAISQVVLRQLQ